MTPLLFPLHAADALAERLCRQQGLELGRVEQRRYPDGETFLRLATPVAGRQVVLFATLDRPDDKILPLLFAADAARQQDALGVGLVAPYLPYMRQDKAFSPGEAVTSRTFARLLSGSFDWLVTIDPHLHRYPSLDAIYSVPAVAASAAGPIAEWLRANVERPFLVGPDAESAQWVERIAALAGARSAVLEKRRDGDFDVAIGGGNLAIPAGSTPVVVDDIASSGSTLIEAVRLLGREGHAAPVCIVVHPLFAGDAYERLLEAGPAAVASANTVPHVSNRIDVTPELGEAVARALAARRGVRPRA